MPGEKGNKMNKALPILALLLTGCVSGTGVVPMGSGSYMVSAQNGGPIGSLGAIKAKALKEAADFCAAKSQDFAIIKTSDIPRSFSKTPETSIEFKCVTKAS
jgi:hypothetical protein